MSFRGIRQTLLWTGAGLGLAVLGYATTVAATWSWYGHPTFPRQRENDRWLDRFIPEYDVVERHRVRVAAPADVTLAAAADTDLQASVVVRSIIRARELVLGAEPDAVTRPRGLLAEMTALGWGQLAEVPGREIVVGAVTQPWQGRVVFRAVPPESFASFREPDFVKIVWTLRADPVSATESIFLTETRVLATDAEARRKFRWYWARFSPGIVLIRRMALGMVKEEAERRARTAGAPLPALD